MASLHSRAATLRAAVPWWAVAFAALVFSGHLEECGVTVGFGSLGDGLAQVAGGSFLEDASSRNDNWRRRLADVVDHSREKHDPQKEKKADVVDHSTEKHDSQKEKKAALLEKAIDVPAFNVSISCYLMIDPCGNVTFGDRDVSLSSFFGTVEIPAGRRQFLKAKNFFSEYTVAAVAFVFLLWALKTFCVPSERVRFMRKVRDTCSGVLEEDEDETDDAPTQEEIDAEYKARLSVDSDNFIAPGNIYRLLAVLHPGIIGYMMWSKIAFKACVCAYMQVYLPFKMINNILLDWEFNGVKSPLWFMKEAAHFSTMFAALASLCTIFQGKCVKNVLDGAAANYYILTHRRKTLDEMTDEEKQAVERRKSDRDKKMGGKGYLPVGGVSVPMPQPPHCVIWSNEHFFCGLSVFLNAIMSVELQVVMFLKVATFTGNIQGIAMVALSLYFVFDLDDKVMEGDARLRPMYRRQVLQMTEETVHPAENPDPSSAPPQIVPPLWVNRIAGIMVAASRCMTPFGLLGIVLLSWRSVGDPSIVIGGDGFH